MQVNFFLVWKPITSVNDNTNFIIWREVRTSLIKNTFPSLIMKFTKHLGLSSKDCTSLGVSYFLFTCQKSEFIQSCLLCIVCAHGNCTSFLKEVSRSIAFPPFPELLLEISAFRTSPGSGKMWEDNLLDIFKLKRSHVLESVSNVTFTFTLNLNHTLLYSVSMQSVLVFKIQWCQKEARSTWENQLE